MKNDKQSNSSSKLEKKRKSLSANVKSISISRKNLEYFPYNIPKNNTLNRIDLSFNHIKDLPHDLNSLFTLSLAYNEYSELPKELIQAFNTYPQLISLDISHNALKAFPNELETIKTLTKLNVSHNQIEYISKIRTPIHTIDMSNNKLGIVPEMHNDQKAVFLERNRIITFNKSLHHVVKLSLGYNKLESIMNSVHLESLETFILAFNRLKTLPDLRVCTPKLKYLDVSFNKLTSFPCFPETIEHIQLSGNKITEIPNNLKNLLNLKFLDLSHNKITQIPELPSSITTLNVYDNLISSIEESNTPQLSLLNLCFNNLSTVPILKENKLPFLLISNNCLNTFEYNFSQNFITKLELSNNNLKEIPQEIFELTYLYILNLSSNQIQSFNYDFTNSKLSYLNISNNKISELPTVLPPNLEYLYISNCGLRSLPDGFEKNNEIYFLDISENEISQIPIFPRLKTLQASQNLFKMFPVFSDKIKFIDLSFNQIVSFPSLDHPNLTYLNLSYNNLTSFSYNAIIPLKHLFLTGNPLQSIKVKDKLNQLDIVECPCTSQIVNNTDQFVSSDFKLVQTNKPPCSPGNPPSQTNNMSIENPPIFSHIFGSMQYISQYKCKDVFICYPQHSAYIFCIINSQNLQIQSQELIYNTFERLHQKKPLSGDNIKEVCDSILSIMEQDIGDPVSHIFLGFLKAKSLSAAYYGGFAITILDAEGKILNEYGRKTKKDDSFSMMRRQGERVVFKIKSGVTVRKIQKNENEKWAIIAQAMVLDAISERKFVEVISTSSCAKDISRKLKNHVASSSFKQSFTIGVFGFQ